MHRQALLPELIKRLQKGVWSQLILAWLQPLREAGEGGLSMAMASKGQVCRLDIA